MVLKLYMQILLSIKMNSIPGPIVSSLNQHLKIYQLLLLILIPNSLCKFLIMGPNLHIPSLLYKLQYNNGQNVSSQAKFFLGGKNNHVVITYANSLWTNRGSYQGLQGVFPFPDIYFTKDFVQWVEGFYLQDLTRTNILCS